MKGALISNFLKLAVVTLILSLPKPGSAALWGTDASGELTGSRTSPASQGVYATDGWDGGGFTIEWDISENAGMWTYVYSVNVERKDISHFILEVSEDGEPFTTFSGTETSVVGPRTWTQQQGNPDMPNELYGVKFDFGGHQVDYTIVTNRPPVYGVFYAKDGMYHGNRVVAWSNALGSCDYRTNDGFTLADFIVRPNGVTTVPIPGALWLLGSGLLSLVGLRKKLKV